MLQVSFSLDLPHRLKRSKTEKIALKERLAEPINDLPRRMEIHFVNPVARTVNMGLATALIGGGMLVPLGAIYATEVLNAGDGGFGFLITALGLGMAVGVGLVSWVQRHLSKTKIFTWSLVAAGTFLIISASTSQIHFSGTMTFCIGICAGSVYVLGFTLLHEKTWPRRTPRPNFLNILFTYPHVRTNSISSWTTIRRNI